MKNLVEKFISYMKDARGTPSLFYYSKVYINGKEYNLEVLYETSKNTIRHFKYTPNAIGNLPAIK